MAIQFSYKDTYGHTDTKAYGQVVIKLVRKNKGDEQFKVIYAVNIYKSANDVDKEPLGIYGGEFFYDLAGSELITQCYEDAKLAVNVTYTTEEVIVDGETTIESTKVETLIFAGATDV